MCTLSPAASPAAFKVLIFAWSISCRPSIRSMSSANLRLFSWYPCMEIPEPLSFSPSITLSRYVSKVMGDNGSPCRVPIDDVNNSPMSCPTRTANYAFSPMTWSICVNRLPTPYDFTSFIISSFSSSLDNKPDQVSELSRIIISSLRKATRSCVVSSTELRT